MSVEPSEISAGGSVLQEGAEIRGDVRTGKDMFLKGIIRGDVVCEGRMVIDRHGLVEGNVVCRELVMDGAITGDVQADDKTSLRANAVIKGFLQTSCLLIHPEAVVEKGLRLKDK